jgi:hypothetical protein
MTNEVLWAVSDVRRLGNLAALVANQLAFLRVKLSSFLWLRGRGSDSGTTKLCEINQKIIIKAVKIVSSKKSYPGLSALNLRTT